MEYGTSSLLELFSSAFTVSMAYPLRSRLLSSILMFFISLVVTLIGVWIAHTYSFFLQEKGIVLVHPSLDESDICYDVLSVGDMKVGEEVASFSLKDSALKTVVQEQVERSGKPFCFCKRYLVSGEQPNSYYHARLAWVGPEVGKAFIGVFFMRQSRLMKVLRSQGKHVIVSEDSIPGKYFSSDDDGTVIHPSDAMAVEYRTPKDLKGPVVDSVEYHTYDLEDVPAFSQLPELAFFKWPKIAEALDWNSIFCAKELGFVDDLRYRFRPLPGTCANMPPDKWSMMESELLENASQTDDPFISGLEVCSLFTSFKGSLLYRGMNEYTIGLISSVMGFPSFGLGICFVVSILASLGQFFVLKPWGFEFSSECQSNTKMKDDEKSPGTD